MKFRTDRIVLDRGAETTAQEPTANAGLVDVRLKRYKVIPVARFFFWQG